MGQTAAEQLAVVRQARELLLDLGMDEEPKLAVGDEIEFGAATAAAAAAKPGAAKPAASKAKPKAAEVKFDQSLLKNFKFAVGQNICALLFCYLRGLSFSLVPVFAQLVLTFTRSLPTAVSLAL